MESNIKVLICLFNWILTKGFNHLQTSSKELNGDEFLSLKIGRKTIDFK